MQDRHAARRDELDLDAATRSQLFYALLIKDAGCSANSAKMAALFGADDHVAKRRPSGRLVGQVPRVRVVAADRRARRLVRAARAAGCARSRRRARSTRVPDGGALRARRGDRADARPRAQTAEAIRALDEHWDGNGQPVRPSRRGDPAARRIVCLAQTAEIFHARRRPGRGLRDGVRGAAATGSTRARRASARAATTPRSGIARGADDLGAWEPEERHLVADQAQLDRIADAFAGMIDAKSPWTYRHSDRVELIVIGVSSALGADEHESATCAGRRCCTTSASSRSRTGSSTSRRGSPAPSTPGSASTR